MKMNFFKEKLKPKGNSLILNKLIYMKISFNPKIFLAWQQKCTLFKPCTGSGRQTNKRLGKSKFSYTQLYCYKNEQSFR